MDKLINETPKSNHYKFDRAVLFTVLLTIIYFAPLIFLYLISYFLDLPSNIMAYRRVSVLIKPYVKMSDIFTSGIWIFIVFYAITQFKKIANRYIDMMEGRNKKTISDIEIDE